MRVGKLLMLLPDGRLQEILLGSILPSDVEQNVKKKQLVKNLFSSGTREDITLVATILASSGGKKLLSKIEKYAPRYGGRGGLSEEEIGQIVALCISKRSQNMDSSPTGLPSTFTTSGSTESTEILTPFDVEKTSEAIQYDRFSKEQCLFEQLSKRAEELTQHPGIAQGIVNEFDRRIAIDPVITCLTDSDSKSKTGIVNKIHHPYDSYRAGREIEGAFINGSDVYTDLQNFLLMGCPAGPKDTADFFDIVIRQKIRVIISLNEHGEPEERYYDFWENNRLITLSLRDGWTVQKVSDRLLNQKSSRVGGVRDFKIIESTLVATRGDQKLGISHFHYDGWRDGHPAPSEKLLNSLYERVEQINRREGITPSTPIVINCKAGVGRTGIVAVSWYVRRYIEKCLTEGKSGETINIPEIIYREFRRRRAGIIAHGGQLAQIYSLAARFYRRAVILKRLGSLAIC